MTSLMRAAASACLQMATVTPVIVGDDFSIYFPLVYEHKGFVPDYDEFAVLLAGAAAVAAVVIAPMCDGNLCPIVELIATVAMTVASAYVAKDYGNTTPGPALWLAWGAVALSNWSTAIGTRARRPKP